MMYAARILLVVEGVCHRCKTGIGAVATLIRNQGAAGRQGGDSGAAGAEICSREKVNRR